MNVNEVSHCGTMSLPAVYKSESVQLVLCADKFRQTKVSLVFRQQQLTLHTVPLKLRPYGSTQICLLLLLLYTQ